jgi:hypothetical protein
MENSKEQKSVEWFKMIGDWNDQSTHLKTKYSQLTDEDFNVCGRKRKRSS